MDEDSVIYLVLILISLAFSAFFSGVEIAFVSANRLKIAIDKKQGGFNILSYFAKRPDNFIGTMLLGNNVAIVIYGMLMAIVLEPIIGNYVSTPLLILLIQTIISTLLVLIFAEFLPKTIFRINPNRIISFLSVPLFIIYWILYPFTYITVGLSNLILSLFTKETEEESNFMVFEKTDLDSFLEENIEHDKEVEHEVKIFHNALNFSEVIARDCMIPRNEIVAFEIEDEIKDLREKFIETGLSKILIYRENIDNIIGYVHAHEMFKHPKSIKSVLLPVSIIPETITANKILEELIQKNRSIAIVVDEYGGTSGMITMEDVIEEIFGEIVDEHDLKEKDMVIEKINDNLYLISGRAEIDYINETYNLNLPESEEYETLAGLIIHYTQDIPEKDEEIKINGFTFVVKEVSQTKVELVEILIHKKEE